MATRGDSKVVHIQQQRTPRAVMGRLATAECPDLQPWSDGRLLPIISHFNSLAETRRGDRDVTAMEHTADDIQ